jgi:aerotaxis receptor
MKKSLPIQSEISFTLDDMFFSTTDHQGVILDGNDIFVKISQYTREELIGSPHNIIRHPDMPKIVFKALWDTILKGDPICAYVKNLAKDGQYYWVFATVVPVGDNFLSIRMKPTTPLKKIVEGLYSELLNIEKASGVEASLKHLIKTLNSLGFPDYNAFVLAAISAELISRHQLQSEASPLFDQVIKKESAGQSNKLESINHHLFIIFKLINVLSTHTQSVTEKLTSLENLSKNIEYSALNTIIEAERLGNEGRALSIVAEHISQGAAEAKALNANVLTLVNKMLGGLGKFRTLQLTIALSTLEIEMLTCLLHQWEKYPQSMNEDNVNKNAAMLISLIEECLNNADPVIESLKNDAEKISDVLKQTTQILMTLDFIQKTGSIETARLFDSTIFSQLFLTITNLIKESRGLYKDFSEIINEHINRDISYAVKEYEIVSQAISTIKFK